MKRRAKRTPQARRDVMGIADYIAENNLDAALRFLDAIDHTFRFLAANPQSGEPCQFRASHMHGVRVWPVQEFRNYLVFFRPTEDGVEIERVLHGACNIESIFGED
jgi:toxin ParE1/3/4